MSLMRIVALLSLPVAVMAALIAFAPTVAVTAGAALVTGVILVGVGVLIGEARAADPARQTGQ